MHYNSIQALRGLAACGVVAMHAAAVGGHDPGVTSVGAAGVDLFFVISGFVMARIMPGKSPGQFIAARFFRIYPIWWIAVMPWLIVGGGPLFTSATLWPIIGEGFTLPAMVIGWTLSFEMMFYSAVALAILTRPTLPLAVFFAAFALFPLTDSALVDFIGNPMFLEFLAGVCIARFRHDERLGIAAICIGLFVLALSPHLHFARQTAIDPHGALERVLWWGVPAALLVYGFLGIEHRFSRGGFIQLLGNASYSIYLFHLLPMKMADGWAIRVAAGISLGIFMWWAVERHLTGLLRPNKAVDRAASEIAASARNAPYGIDR